MKKYRPIVMPGVRDIFDDCNSATTKYDADVNNNYGVFGWCTIPSKTMVNMEYDEQSIIVPSSYDRHNRVGGSNFLQMDNDLAGIYRRWVGPKSDEGWEESTAANSWCYLYNTRDWTYFLRPFFDIKQNNDLYTLRLDTYPEGRKPDNSNHLNGVVFEGSCDSRMDDISFGEVVATCEFLAKRIHSEGNLKTLAERYTNMISYADLKRLTSVGDDMNAVYGSECKSLPSDFKVPF